MFIKPIIDWNKITKIQMSKFEKKRKEEENELAHNTFDRLK